MPIYEFYCPNCGADVEELVRSTKDARRLRCPRCNAKGLQRKSSVFSAHAAAQPACPMRGDACESCCGSNGPCRFDVRD